MGQIQVSPPFNIELTPERIFLLQGTVPRSTHHLSLLPYTGYLHPWLHLHIKFHNMENKVERWDTNTFDVLLLTMDSEFQEFQKLTDAFLDFCLPLFLPPSLSCSFSPSPGGQRGKQNFRYLQHQTSTDELISPQAYVWVEFQKQHLRGCFVFSEDSIRTLVKDHKSIFISRWRIFQIHLFFTDFWIMPSCIQY